MQTKIVLVMRDAGPLSENKVLIFPNTEAIKRYFGNNEWVQIRETQVIVKRFENCYVSYDVFTGNEVV